MSAHTILDVLRAIHILGNTATNKGLWEPVRLNLAAKMTDWVALVDAMEQQQLIEVTWEHQHARRPVTFRLLPAGMQRIAATGHRCDPRYCHPPEEETQVAS